MGHRVRLEPGGLGWYAICTSCIWQVGPTTLKDARAEAHEHCMDMLPKAAWMMENACGV